MKRLLIHILISIFITLQIASGQNTNLITHNFNLDDGLSHSLITSIAEDNLGFMWFATEDGLNRFDGYEFKVYPAGNNNKTLLKSLMSDIYIDNFDQIWISYRGGGISRLDPVKEIFHHYIANSNIKGCISSNTYEDIHQYKNKIFFEDTDSNIWIATSYGLNKFNRAKDNFNWIVNDLDNENSLSNNKITFITEDYEKYLWIGTKDGLNRLDIQTNRIKRFTNLISNNNKNKISITYIKAYKDSSIWVGTLKNGLYIIDQPNSNNPKVTHLSDITQNSRFDQAIGVIFNTNAGDSYVASVNGLYRVKKNNTKFNYKQIIATKELKPFSFVEDKSGDVWAILGGNSNLIRINSKTKTLENFDITIDDATGLFLSSSNILWVASEKDGVFMVDLNAKHFNIIDDNEKHKLHLSDKDTYGIYEDDNRNLYVGTKTKLNKINLENGNLIKYNSKIKHVNNLTYEYSKTLRANLFGVIKETKDNKLWLGSYNNKVCLFDPKTKIILNFHHNDFDSKSFKTWSTRTICITNDNNIYFGGTSNGLSKINEDGLSFSFFPIVENDNTKGTNDNWLNIIKEDSDGLIWIGTLRGGVNTYNPKTNIFKHYYKDPSNSKSISNNYVNCILQPQIYGKDIMWIGTMGGLNKFNKKTKSFKRYTTSNGMPSNSIHGILEDNTGKLWISTNKGLVLFDPITEKIRVYTTEDGLPGNEFNGGSYFKNKYGTMYFGGTNGIVYFNPQEIKDSPYYADLVFTKFLLYNENISANDTIDGNIVLTNSISYTDKILLNYKQNVISFSFASLNYKSPKKLQYRYILDGFEQKWNNVDANQRFAHYTNLPSGNYTFKVISTNGDGKWSNTPAQIKVIITPPFWETTLFKFIFSLLFIGLIILIIHFRTRSLKTQKINLEKEVTTRTKELKAANSLLKGRQEEILRQSDEIIIQRDNLKEQNNTLEYQKTQIEDISNKLHESDQSKLKFFTNISHEFRTPLTLIMAPTEKLLNQNNYNDITKTKADLSLIFRNVNRLFRLINQLLEIRKVETGNLKLHVQNNDIVSFLKTIFQLFTPLSEKKSINFQFKSDFNSKLLLFDMDKIEKIIGNLLSNAFKYTPNNGNITLTIREHNKNTESPMLKISVIDSGVGISQEYIPFVFDRFSSNYKTKKSGQISSGIGLSLSKDLTEAHRGIIKVISKENTGTTIEVYIPLNPNTYSSSETQESSTQSNTLENTQSLIDMPEYLSNDNISSDINNDDSDNFKILVVEDNIDLQKLLYTQLSTKYSVVIAGNGEEGLTIAREQIPDLIISDVMMPKMDGLEMCKQIKSGEDTSHIPVFLLTAKSDPEHQLSGFETGADDYITKPFSVDILQYRIQNILTKRKELHDKFANDANYIPDNIKINQIDQGFLEKFVKYVKDNIDDSDLSGDIIASHMGMCKGNLYKKLKTLNGMSVNIYVRTIRLKVAAKLLKSGEYNISDVAYSVGFNNPKYFSTCFSELFSISPKEYMNK